MKNKTEIVKSISGIANKSVMKLKKHSPEILVVAGIAGTVVSAIIACKATTKVNKIVEDTKNDIDKVHTATETGITEAGESYSAEIPRRISLSFMCKPELNLPSCMLLPLFLELCPLPASLHPTIFFAREM